MARGVIPDIVVRPARADDAPAMARVHVQAWRETYRGIMRDDALDDPRLLEMREAFWDAALTDKRYAENRCVVAEYRDEVVGIAMAGPQLDHDHDVESQLYVLYVLAAHHGSGAGRKLLDAVAPAPTSACLWVADPNPRAQAFYRKHGFRDDGLIKTTDGVREMHMTRSAAHED